MVNKILSLFLAISFIQTGLNAQTGTITGDVRTSDGHPAEMVNIQLRASTCGTVTDMNGHFVLENVPAGTHTVLAFLVGMQSREQIMQVEKNAAVKVDFVLAENAEQMQEVVISSTRNRYNTSRTSSSLRLTTPLLEVPQNIQIVSGDALKDQQVISMSDGLIRNVSGAVRIEHWGDLYTNISARGSQIQAFRNGFNVVNSSWGPLTEDMSFVDHIEFVKGPAGFMLGNGDPSGLYNVVTKKPTGRDKSEVSMTLGSFDLFRTTVDLDGHLGNSGKVLYRFNASAQNKGSHRANEYNNRYALAPVIAYQISKNTRLSFEYNYQHAKMSNVGSYYVFGTEGYAALARNFTYLPAGLPATRIHDHSFYVNFDHRISNNWKVTTQLSRFSYRQEGSSMWPGSVSADGNVIRGVSSWDATSTMSMGQIFLNGDIATGTIRHRILAGLDMANKIYFADWGQYHELDTAGAAFNVYGNNPAIPVNGYPRFDRTTPLEERALAAGGTIDQRYSSAYLQEELVLFENKLRLTIAGRYTNIDQSEYGGAGKSAEKFTPRAGVSLSVHKTTSVYGLYDQAFIPQAGQLAGGGSAEPITGDNLEAGVKKNWFGGRWNTTVSLYRIVKNNEITADPNSPPASGLSIVMGQKTAEGVEFDLRGRLISGLDLVANYAYTDSRITAAAEGLSDISVGDIVPGYAKHTINGWLTYTFQETKLKGFGLSAGVTSLLSRRTYWDPSPDPEQQLENYLKVDAGIFWEKDRFRITANMFNVLNAYLYTGSYYKWLNAYYWQSEPGRNFRISVNYKFKK